MDLGGVVDIGDAEALGIAREVVLGIE